MELLERYLDISIFSVLGFMSFLALARFIERQVFYSRVQVQRYRESGSLKIDLQYGLVTLATVASNAPYIGLLGTVFGIMLTFHDIGTSGQIDTASVMSGLALALKATALGLVVAIPAMIAYNGLAARAERLMLQWDIEDQRLRRRAGVNRYD